MKKLLVIFIMFCCGTTMAQQADSTKVRLMYEAGAGIASLDFQGQGYSTAFASNLNVGVRGDFKYFYVSGAVSTFSTTGNVDLSGLEYRVRTTSLGLDLRAGSNYDLTDDLSLVFDFGFAYHYQAVNEYESKVGPDFENENRGFNGSLSSSLGFQYDIRKNRSVFLKLSSLTGLFDNGYADGAAVRFDNVSFVSLGFVF